ncbi:MAG TPA: hypothetical protein P5307_23265, partial [Pirellulaceae bacterium]|nr:hypothetical protein [Pirellulaceae bacterium]
MNLTKPLTDDVLTSVDVSTYDSNTPHKMEEATKQRVRRLAAHCQTYRGSVTRLAILQIATTVIPLTLIVAAMFATVRTNYWLTLLLAIPAGG